MLCPSIHQLGNRRLIQPAFLNDLMDGHIMFRCELLHPLNNCLVQLHLLTPRSKYSLHHLFFMNPSIPLPYHNLLKSKYLSLFSILKALFLQLCDKTKNIELLLLFIPCTERIRQEPSIVKFLTYQKTDDF